MSTAPPRRYRLLGVKRERGKMKRDSMICPTCHGNGFVPITVEAMEDNLYDTLMAELPKNCREVKQCENCNSTGEAVFTGEAMEDNLYDGK